MGESRRYPFSPDHGLDIEPIYSELREHEPVSRVRLPYGGDAWLVTRYSDARIVLADPRFSRAATLGADIPRMLPDPDYAPAILTMDPPAHTRIRRLVAGAFSARQVAALRPMIEAHADDLIDRMLAAGPPADLVAGFGKPLAMAVICDVLGVPPGDQERFRGWSTTAVTAQTVAPAELEAALANLSGYLTELVAARRRHPTGDVLGQLVAARDDGEQLSEEELVFLGVTLLVAGHETSEKAIADAMFVLLQRPQQVERLRADPGLLPTAVEELLRYLPLETAGGAFSRVVTEELELGGVRLEAGDVVFVRLSVANRDPRTFAEPDRLDLTRARNPHLAFGHGIHLCLGSYLGRTELQVSLDRLLDRLPRLRLAVDPAEVQWRTDGFVRGPVRLPVTW
ncbi:cytochrome P450 [Micromonospora yangpuensis]|uniref:Nocardicin N-oxygenase n=1 Tax=Micromonospora yangpuensis TaxID=683228 RepID=A0A1C6UUW0_9ACTN|nr:cytochrome P450 [Micromonospora yangpuensis]SCL57609.1 nocardicin N-oxygenase [Micromonospora yangpuensis]